MNRRNFFKTSALATAAISLSPSITFGKDEKATKDNHNIFDITFTHDIQTQGKVTRIWLPLPLNAPYQSIMSTIENSGNYDEIYQSDFDIPTLYAKFSSPKPTLQTKFTILTSDRKTDFSKVKFNENEKLNDKVKKYLKPTTSIQINGIVKQKTDEITKNINGDLEKARAIFNWTAKNMTRDESVIGCGLGDAKMILESGKLSGKCTDISSVFVALCRAAGIPAREIFGIRVGKSKFSKAMGSGDGKMATITKAQHCRAEFYLKGYGWIPCDPGDVAKVKLAENLTNDDEKIVKLREYLFGNWEMCWIGFNTGRDFILKPKPYEKPLNNFAYPYCEVDDNVLNYYDPKSFAYEYKTITIK